MYSWPSIFSFLLLLFLFSFFVDTPMWDSGKSWCALGCPSFLLSLREVVAGVGVALAINLLFLLLLLFIHLRGTVAKAGVPLAVHLSFKPKWGGSRSWCTPGHPSFVSVVVVVYTPTWDSSKSYCALGCPSFVSSLGGVVAGVGVPLATHLLLFFCCRSLIHPCGCSSFLLSLNGPGGDSRSECTPGHKLFVAVFISF